jgi:hypothetical protein
MAAVEVDPLDPLLGEQEPEFLYEVVDGRYFTSPVSVRILAPGDDLDGGDILPGFRFPLTDLFNKAGKPA